MRKHAGVALAATAMVLAVMLWAKITVDATKADVAARTGGPSPYGVLSNPYLPIQHKEEAY